MNKVTRDIMKKYPKSSLMAKHGLAGALTNKQWHQLRTLPEIEHMRWFITVVAYG